MNQTKKRLSIIKIAISITDIETIQLQILKLGLLKTDEKIQNIISMLQAANYAQAQGLITTYIETATENILQRSSQEKRPTLTKEEQSTIDEFQLFISPEENEAKIEIDINEFLSVSPTIPIKETIRADKETNDVATHDFDSLLNLDTNDVLPNNIDLDISYDEEDNFFTPSAPSNKTTKPYSDINQDIPKDTFFDISGEETAEEAYETIDNLSYTLMPNIKVEKTEIKHEETLEKETLILIQDKPLQEKSSQEKPLQENVLEINILQQEKKPLKELSPLNTVREKIAITQYKSIPYITQKLERMNKQYPSSYKCHEPSSTLNDLLTKISQETYNEEEIEETLADVKKLMENQKFSQAAQLLLVCAATPSPFAQFILARELYKGILFTANIPQAFILLNTLAMDDYPEALCDLGQFYENGIGTKKDKKRAEHLYKDAMEFGIKRAKTHFERIKQSNKGFFRK